MIRWLEELANNPLYAFADWPNITIPKVCAGVYAIYDKRETFLYVGMAGAALTEAEIEKKKAGNKTSGLLDRLGSHASGYRSGDMFNIYICDRFVLRLLAAEQVANIASGTLKLDSLNKVFIRENLYYRYVITPNHLVRSLERHIKKEGIDGVMPSINALPC